MTHVNSHWHRTKLRQETNSNAQIQCRLIASVCWGGSTISAQLAEKPLQFSVVFEQAASQFIGFCKREICYCEAKSEQSYKLRMLDPTPSTIGKHHHLAPNNLSYTLCWIVIILRGFTTNRSVRVACWVVFKMNTSFLASHRVITRQSVLFLNKVNCKFQISKYALVSHLQTYISFFPWNKVCSIPALWNKNEHKVTPLYGGHIPINFIQRAILSVGSSYLALTNPARGGRHTVSAGTWFA